MYIYIYIKVARVPRLIHFEVGDECERKGHRGCLEGGGKEIRMVVEEGVGKGDEDGGGHGGAG